MGEIRVNGNTVAVFENGTVYAGGSTWGIVLGYYGGGRIEDEYRKTVARYGAGTAYDLDTISFGTMGWESGSALCHCSGTTIYEGGNSWNNTIGSFTGDSDGACAASVLYFSLHKKATVQREGKSTIPTGEKGANFGNYGFWGGLIVAALCVLMTYVFWFTDEGREMLFGEPEGLFTFGGCIMSAIIGSYKILQQEELKKWIDIGAMAAIWYLVALAVTWIVGIFSGIADNAISFEYCLVVLFLSPIIVVGAAAPVFIIQILALIVMKHKTKK